MQNPPEPQTPLKSTPPQASPTSTGPVKLPEGESKASSILAGNKGVIIAVIVVIILAIFGITALFGLSDTNNFQGKIQLIENQTNQLQNE